MITVAVWIAFIVALLAIGSYVGLVWSFCQNPSGEFNEF